MEWAKNLGYNLWHVALVVRGTEWRAAHWPELDFSSWPWDARGQLR